MLRLILLLLLVASPATAVVNSINWAILDDDMSRPMAEFMNDGNDPDWLAGGAPVATPNLNALAAAGFSHPYIITSSLCSPTRSRFLDFGPNWVTGMGGAQTPDDDQADGDLSPRVMNLISEAQAAGVKVAVFGKFHLATAHIFTHGRTWMNMVGPDASIGWLGNVTNVVPGLDYSGVPWDDCQGNRLNAVFELDGTYYFSTEHSTKNVYDWALAYESAVEAAGLPEDYLIIVLPPSPHSPNRPGDNVTLDCNGGTETQNDLPPGAVWSAGLDDGDVYLLNAAYNDLRLGDVVTGRDWSRDFVLKMPDNGTYTAVLGEVPECQASRGAKNTPWPCGVFGYFAMAGPGIVPGSRIDDRLNSVDDVPATILDFLGTHSHHTWGMSIKDCMTASNGQSAANCDSTRDTVGWAEFMPNFGIPGNIFRGPDPVNDAGGTWNHFENGMFVWERGGPFVFVYRWLYDESVSPMTFTEGLVPINVGVYQEMYVHPTQDWWASATPGPLSETDQSGWDIPATQGAIDALILGHRAIEAMYHRGGQPTPTFTGGSSSGGF
jgi:hypothetical protein